MTPSIEQNENKSPARVRVPNGLSQRQTVTLCRAATKRETGPGAQSMLITP